MQERSKTLSAMDIKHAKKAMEDLIVAVFFAESAIEHTENGRELTFNLTSYKEQYLRTYLSRYSLKDSLYLNPTTMKWHIRQSVTLEKILKEWTEEGEIITLDPRLIRASTLLLWILLFARKTKRSVLINTNIPESIRKDIPYFFEIHFNSPVYVKRDKFHIKPYYQVLTRAIQMQRPASENLEFYNLLPEQEVQVFRQNMAAREEELSANGNL